MNRVSCSALLACSGRISGWAMNRLRTSASASAPIPIASRTAFFAQGSFISAASPASKSSVGCPSLSSTSTGGSARSGIRLTFSLSAKARIAAPRSVLPGAFLPLSGFTSKVCTITVSSAEMRPLNSVTSPQTSTATSKGVGSLHPGRPWLRKWLTCTSYSAVRRARPRARRRFPPASRWWG